MNYATIYSDGSCQNPRRKGGGKNPGGCAAIVVFEDPERIVKVGNGEFETFVNRMELLGAITGMQYLSWYCNEQKKANGEEFRQKNFHVEVITDSTYVFRAAIGLSKRSANSDLWARFSRYGATFGRITVEHQPRNTHRWMEEADRVAGIIRRKLIDGNAEITNCVTRGHYFEADI